MRVLIILFVIHLIQCADKSHTETKCEGILVENRCHKEEIMSNGINRPYQLSYFNHTVYFSFNEGDDDKDTFQIGYVTSDNKVPTVINSTKNGFATAIDHKNKIAYFGGSDGIYEHDLTKPGEIEHVIKGHDVWQMFFKHHLYFIEYPKQRLHKKVGNRTELVEHIREKIYQFAIDGHDKTFVTTKMGLVEVINATERILYKGPKTFRAIAVNNKGVPYFCGQNGIYIMNKENYELEKIAHIKNIFGLTFDSDDNFIYSDPHQIVKLLQEPTKKTKS